MKQKGVVLSESRQAAGSDEMADLDAWRGYEFWSAQVEARMQIGERTAKYGARPELYERERESDVLPF